MVNSISNKKNIRKPVTRKLVKENYVYDTDWVKEGIPSTEELLDDYNTFGDSYFECYDDYTTDYHIVILIENGKFTIYLDNEVDGTQNSSTYTVDEIKKDGIGKTLNALNYYAYPVQPYYSMDENCNKTRQRRTAKRPVRKESKNSKKTNRKLKEWFNPNIAVEDLTDALEIINNVATNAQRSDDYSSAKPITAVATQLKNVINSLKIK